MFTQEWADVVNRHTRRLAALLTRIKRNEALLVELGAPLLDRLEAAERRIEALELDATRRSKGLHVSLTSAKRAVRESEGRQ
ncbi:hypothetical protein [Cupriavidus oxalaticus]|uniref:Uncharacterized protein n=1 Tax=Cupriavidus oxalaticus TaxID=96344 RepID=A0A5P3VTU8_9BURK|nr:hypothetical protein [Cupriavidus oxalaticus]QEZ48953.1 hypothetical protein D2917_32345 [Cupriavidus oxalaticus]